MELNITDNLVKVLVRQRDMAMSKCAELEAKLDEINTEKQTEREAQQPQSAMQRILNGAS